jgi:acyl-CoA synthetase (AMP-forming)/AMP-acid ligase II
MNAGSGGKVEAGHRVDVPEEAPAVISFTSGSTGTPKALVRSHGVLRGQYRALRDAMDLRPGQVDLCALPVFVLANLGAGVTTLLPDADLGRPGRIHPAPVHEQMRRESPTRLTASPAFIERLLTAPDAWTSVQRVDTGGAPVPYDLQRRIREATGADVHVLYGSSEAEPIADLAHKDIRQSDVTAMRHGDGLLVGRPGSHVEVRILPDRWGTPIGPFTREDLEIQSLPTGMAGEIVVAGPHVVPGYLHGEGDAENKIRVGDQVWHRTGDAGRFDAEGRLWLLGRCSERLYGGAGETGTVSDAVYPLSVELAAQAIPGVRRAAALVVDERRSVVLELDDGARHKESAIAREVLEAVGGGMMSAYVMDRLPVDRRHNAKVDYGQLRNDLSHRRLVADVQTEGSPQVIAN